MKLKQSQAAAPNVLESRQLVPVVDPPPLVTQEPPLFTPAEKRYRSTIKALSAHKHSYVRIKLKKGKGLTYLLRDVGDVSFSLHADALGGSLYYDQLVEMPRPIPGVGTRIKQGAEWTSLITFVVVFFIPLAMMHVIPDC